MRRDESRKKLALYGIGISVFLVLLPLYGVFAPIELRAESETHNSEARLGEYKNQDIKTLILEMCKEYEVNCLLAADLAEWESQLNPSAQNPNTTAKGIYQFLDGTWEELCEGNVLDEKDNIVCFMELMSKSKKNISHWYSDIVIARLLWEAGYIHCTNFELRTCWPNF